MWETRILILDVRDMKDKYDTPVQVTNVIEDGMNKLGRDEWEPWHVDVDDEGLIVFFKRWVIE